MLHDVKVLMHLKYEMGEYLKSLDNSSIENLKELRIYSKC